MDSTLEQYRSGTASAIGADISWSLEKKVPSIKSICGTRPILSLCVPLIGARSSEAFHNCLNEINDYFGEKSPTVILLVGNPKEALD